MAHICTVCPERCRKTGEEPELMVPLATRTLKKKLVVMVCPICDAIDPSKEMMANA